MSSLRNNLSSKKTLKFDMFYVFTRASSINYYLLTYGTNGLCVKQFTKFCNDFFCF